MPKLKEINLKKTKNEEELEEWVGAQRMQYKTIVILNGEEVEDDKTLKLDKKAENSEMRKAVKESRKKRKQEIESIYQKMEMDIVDALERIAKVYRNMEKRKRDREGGSDRE